VFGLIGAYWPYLLGVAFLIGPAVLTLLGWGIGWGIAQKKFSGRIAGSITAGLGLALFIVGLLVFFFWPTAVVNDPTAPTLPDNDVLLRLFDGFALATGGALTVVASLMLWGTFELVAQARRPPAA
jgi:hypothetical protein